MVRNHLLLCLAALALLGGCRAKAELLRQCPQTRITNNMPTVGDAPPTSYYILDGERREIEELDANWVRQHCEVKEEIVY